MCFHENPLIEPSLRANRKGYTMKQVFTKLLVLLVMASAIGVPVHASDSEKAAECVEIAEKAASFVQEKGTDYALRVFSVSKGPFIDKDLYVFACSMDGVMLAHPYSRDLIGQNVADFKDTEGKAIFKEFHRIAEERGAGWVEYRWRKPAEAGDFPKSTYIRRVAATNLYVGVGYYK
jgi:cytochrome c